MVFGPRRRLGALAAATLTTVVLVTVTLLGCTGSDQPALAPAAVTIGMLAPATGAGAVAGIDAVRGAQLAVEVVNNSYPELPLSLAAGNGLPGLAGRRLALVSVDSRGAPDEATNQVATLVANGAVAFVAADSPEVAAAAGSQTQRLRVPLVDAASTADYVTELGMDWYFRTAPSDRLLDETAFALLQRQLAGTEDPRIAIVAEAGSREAAATAEVVELAQRAGYTVATQLTTLEHSRADTDAGRVDTDPGVTEQAQRIDLGGADVVLALTNTESGATAVSRLVAALNRPVPLIVIGSAEPAPVAGSTAALLRTASWSAELARRSPAAKALSDLYAARFSAAMTDAAANAFTATITLATAIDAAGSDDPAAIRAALRQSWQPATALIMPWSGVRFDANGQNQLAAGVVEARVADGFRVVFPRELSSGPMIWTVAR